MKGINLLFGSLLGVILFSGCSASNPFGIGYDSSVCSDSKSFGVCGSPTSIYKYKDKLRDVQNKYLSAKLDTTLYFSVNDDGIIQVKEERDAPWERYDISKWYSIIKDKNKAEEQRYNEEQQKAENLKKQEKDVKVVDGWNGRVYSDLPVTNNDDLSIKYQKQGPLIVTRTSIGDIIRDQGYIQQLFISNYVDYDGDLISSHEAMVVVREPEWVVGEKAPKNVKVENFPTPMSERLINESQVDNIRTSEIVQEYNNNSAEGYLMAKEYTKDNNNDADMAVIQNFIKK